MEGKENIGGNDIRDILQECLFGYHSEEKLKRLGRNSRCLLPVVSSSRLYPGLRADVSERGGYTQYIFYTVRVLSCIFDAFRITSII